MNVRTTTVARHIFSFLVVAGLLYYLWEHWEVLCATLDASLYHVLGLLLCILMTWVFNSLQVFLLLRALGVKVSFWENILMFIVAALGNYLPMRVGSVLRMHYFKKVHGLQYAKFGGVIATRTLILVAGTGILGCAGVAGLKISGLPFNTALLGVFIGMILISLGVYLIPFPRKEYSRTGLVKIWSDCMSGFEIIRSRPTLVWQLMGLILIQFIVVALRLGITFDAVHIRPSPWVLVVLAPTTVLITFISVTPGSLGIREWVIGIVSFASGVDFRSGIFAGTLDRAILMACTFLFGAVSLVYVWSRVREERDNSLQQ